MPKSSGIVQRIIPSDLKRANSMISGALKSGYKKGSIYVEENNITGVRKTYTKSKTAVKELKTLKLSKDDIPAIAAAIAGIAPIPIPGLSFMVYGVGHAIQYGIKNASKITSLFR